MNSSFENKITLKLQVEFSTSFALVIHHSFSKITKPKIRFTILILIIAVLYQTMFLLLLFFIISYCISGISAQIREFETSYLSYAIHGYEPSSEGSYPLFIYLQSTDFPQWNWDTQIYTQYIASNNIVAAAVSYGNILYPRSCDGFISKAISIFNRSNSTSAISILCSKINVDCKLGVILAGFSQGAQLSSMAANYAQNDIIKGVYEMGGGYKRIDMNNNFEECLSFKTLSISSSSIRSCIGEQDPYFGGNAFGIREQQIIITGVDNCSPLPLTMDCIQSDGSGWYIISDQEAQKNATHCYAYNTLLTDSCSITNSFTSQYYGGCKLDCLWSMESNFEWLMNTLQTS
eukprot:142477_1